MVAATSIFGDEIQAVLNDKDKGYFPSPTAWEDQFIYFLLPDRFSDGKESDSTEYNPKSDFNAVLKTETSTTAWLDAGTKFCGGTINGVRSKLDYLKGLGVTGVWIGPIWKQVPKLDTYHGYGVQNFLEVEPRFGTKEELKELVSEAHSRGMVVVLDIILNHSGNVWQYVFDNPTYNNGQKYQVRGYDDPNHQPTISFSQLKGTDINLDSSIWPQELQDPNTFTQKGSIQNWDASPEYLDGDFFDLKDINLGEEAPDNFTPTPALITLTEAYKYWIAYADVDGFRLDTVKHMGRGPTRYFSQSIHEFAERIGKDKFMIVGEITGGNAYDVRQVTGLDAALGIGNMMQLLWRMPRGQSNPKEYFDMFRNAHYLLPESKNWLMDKVFTMIDDHDQVWRPTEYKGRFCADGSDGVDASKLMVAAIGLNLTTQGIPCLYYGSEQRLDGGGGNDGKGHSPDQYIREAMFGGGFGAFRSTGRHCFDVDTDVYKAVSQIAAVRSKQAALRRGRQYLREISGDGNGWGYPYMMFGRMLSLVAWSRLLAGEEVLCVINSDDKQSRTAWVTVDAGIQRDGQTLQCLFPTGSDGVQVKQMSDRLAVQVALPAGGFALFK